jgi:hypothetical protein
MGGDFVHRVVSLLNSCIHDVLVTVMQPMMRVLVMDREHNNLEATA